MMTAAVTQVPTRRFGYSTIETEMTWAVRSSTALAWQLKLAPATRETPFRGPKLRLWSTARRGGSLLAEDFFRPPRPPARGEGSDERQE